MFSVGCFYFLPGFSNGAVWKQAIRSVWSMLMLMFHSNLLKSFFISHHQHILPFLFLQAFHRIIESLHCRRRPFGPSSLHRPQSHPGLIPITPCIYPARPHDTKGQFSMANAPNQHVFGVWEETGAPGGNPRRHGENVQTPHRQ